jgi:hypothetical protein
MTVSSKLIAGVNVGDRHGEKDEADRQHDDVQHGSAPEQRMRQSVRVDAQLRRSALI